jgi:hypothetical protein
MRLAADTDVAQASLVNVAAGIGLPFFVLFLLRVIVQILRERG